MQIELVCSRRHQRKGRGSDGGKEKRKRSDVDGWKLREVSVSEGERERPLKEVRASWSLKWREVEGGSGSRLGRLQSTAQH